MNGISTGRVLGSYLVKPTPTAMTRAWRLFKGRARDYFELRRHTLKLAHFPGLSSASGGQVLDVDWDWVTGTGERGVGELRISDTIGGFDNLRVIFYVADVALKTDPLPRIWAMTVFQKKNERFSPNELRAFAAMKKMIVARYY